ncbi:hypothetical protein GN956_G26220, partial [Arapaima gigas]
MQHAVHVATLCNSPRYSSPRRRSGAETEREGIRHDVAAVLSGRPPPFDQSCDGQLSTPTCPGVPAVAGASQAASTPVLLVRGVSTGTSPPAEADLGKNVPDRKNRPALCPGSVWTRFYWRERLNQRPPEQTCSAAAQRSGGDCAPWWTGCGHECGSLAVTSLFTGTFVHVRHSQTR